MSVLKSKRKESAIKFLDTAYDLDLHTIKCCMKLPKRYTFFIGTELARLASEVHTHCKAANSIYPTRRSAGQLRELVQSHIKLQILADEGGDEGGVSALYAEIGGTVYLIDDVIGCGELRIVFADTPIEDVDRAALHLPETPVIHQACGPDLVYDGYTRPVSIQKNLSNQQVMLVLRRDSDVPDLSERRGGRASGRDPLYQTPGKRRDCALCSRGV